VYDKSQAHEFKKLVVERITAIEQQGHLPRGTIRLSYLQTCCGERFDSNIRVMAHSLDSPFYYGDCQHTY